MSASEFASIDPGWAALLGALVGGAATLGGTVLTGYLSSRAAKEEQRARVGATALLLQDDFWHYQATLARALDRSAWWNSVELLEQQASIGDRKTVWAALAKEKMDVVAAAQGWMDYLIQLRKGLPAQAPPLVEPLTTTVKRTFCLLEEGRRALAQLAEREATDFGKSRVMFELDNPNDIVQLLDNECASLILKG